MFRMEIETGNAAFDGAPGEELARILGVVAEQVREALGYAPDADLSKPVRDVNGAAVGTWQFMPDA